MKCYSMFLMGAGKGDSRKRKTVAGKKDALEI